MDSAAWEVVILVSPILIGWVAQRYSHYLTCLAALIAVGVTSLLFSSSYVSALEIERRAAILPSYLVANGVDTEIELTDEARLVLAEKTTGHPLDVVALIFIVGSWNIFGVMLGFGITRLLTSTYTHTDEPQLQAKCPECESKLDYHVAFIGLEGRCPTCDASIIFPPPHEQNAV